MSATSRSLLPAPPPAAESSSSGDPNQEPSRPYGGRQKRVLIESACSACRRRKSKCDGTRPICSRCRALGTECTYDAQQGESRWSALKRHANLVEAERNELSEILRFLRLAPDHEATALLYRIRAEAEPNWSAILTYVRERASSPDRARAVATSPAALEPPVHTHLPPISTLFETFRPSPRYYHHSPRRRTSIASNGSTNSTGSYSSAPSLSDSTATHAPDPH